MATLSGRMAAKGSFVVTNRSRPGRVEVGGGVGVERRLTFQSAGEYPSPDHPTDDRFVLVGVGGVDVAVAGFEGCFQGCL